MLTASMIVDYSADTEGRSDGKKRAGEKPRDVDLSGPFPPAVQAPPQSVTETKGVRTDGEKAGAAGRV